MKEEVQRLIEEFLDKAGEHCEAVQVLATWNKEGQTHCFKLGSGNWYARQGMAHDFIKTDNATVAAHEISQALQPEDDDE